MLTKGKITAHELKKVGQELGENMSDDEWNHVFNKADLDDDGFVTADDFYNIMTHKVYWEQWCCTFDPSIFNISHIFLKVVFISFYHSHCSHFFALDHRLSLVFMFDVFKRMFFAF